MGRPSSYSSTLSDCLRLDVRMLKRGGWLRPGWSVPWAWTVNGRRAGSIVLRPELGAVTLSYRIRVRGAEQWWPVEERVAIEETACHFGGARPWWVCPGCGERAAILYLWDGRARCRRCRGLHYATQHENAWSRRVTRLQKLRMRLGGTPSTIDPMPPRPKGMHHTTYLRLQSEMIRLTEAVFATSPMLTPRYRLEESRRILDEATRAGAK